MFFFFFLNPCGPPVFNNINSINDVCVRCSLFHQYFLYESVYLKSLSNFLNNTSSSPFFLAKLLKHGATQPQILDSATPGH